MAILSVDMLDESGITKHNENYILAFADAYQGIRSAVCIVTRAAFDKLFPGNPASLAEVELQGILVRVALPDAIAKF